MKKMKGDVDSLLSGFGERLNYYVLLITLN